MEGQVEEPQKMGEETRGRRCDSGKVKATPRIEPID